MSKAKITPMENGPLMVSDLSSLKDSSDKKLNTDQVTALCRCGKSASKPYCDGTHVGIAFESKKISDGNKSSKHSYLGKGLTVYYNKQICAHAAECVNSLPEVFDPKKKPWVNVDAVSSDELIKVIQRCPSGALSYKLNGKEEVKLFDQQEEEIQILENGPYAVKKGIEMENTEFSKDTSKEHFTLCRCGKSANKPFCDGVHTQNKFE